MKITEVTYGTKEYQSLLDFRYINLRKPLNLQWSSEDLDNEQNQIHCALFINNQIHGSCLIKSENNKVVRIRQMAISKEFQQKGYGKKLLVFAESLVFKKKFSKIIITARLSALEFYLKSGYKVIGKKFIDVTVESIKMVKIIKYD